MGSCSGLFFLLLLTPIRWPKMPDCDEKSSVIPSLPASALLTPPSYDAVQSPSHEGSAETSQIQTSHPSSSSPNVQPYAGVQGISQGPPNPTDSPSYGPTNPPFQAPQMTPPIGAGATPNVVYPMPRVLPPINGQMPVYGAQYSASQASASCYSPQGKG